MPSLWQFWTGCRVEIFFVTSHGKSPCDGIGGFICLNSNEARYEVWLPFKDDHEILPDTFTHSKHQLSHLTKKLSKNSDLLCAYNGTIKNQLNAKIIKSVLEI